MKSIFLTARFTFESLKETRGCILNTAGAGVRAATKNRAAFAAATGGMIALTKAMTSDYAAWGIRVNAILPAPGDCARPEAVAHAAVFLLSEKARFVTGSIMPVSGGAERGPE